MPQEEPTPPAALPTGAQRADTHGKAGRDLPAAIVVGLVLVGLLAVTLAWWNFGFVLIVAAALCVGAHEITQALAKVGMRAALVPICVGTLVIVIGSYYAGKNPVIEGTTIHMPSNTLMLAGLGATIIATLVWRMPAGPKGYVRDCAASLFVIGYVPLLGSFVTLMLAGEQGPARVVGFIATVAASDTGGYIAGVLFGKHPLAPTISPKKTYEGLAGSLALSMAVGACVAIFLLGAPWWVGVVLGFVSVVVGTTGDLVESLIKRDVGIKDMSSILPGHGGLMDRMDSLLVAAPVAWLVLFLTVPGG